MEEEDRTERKEGEGEEKRRRTTIQDAKKANPARDEDEKQDEWRKGKI